MCAEGDVPGTLASEEDFNGKEMCRFLQCSAGRWPKRVSVIIISLLGVMTAFVLRFHGEGLCFPEQE